MKILFSDENNRLADVIKDMMQGAADEALSSEFSEELTAGGVSLEDADVEVAMSVVSEEEIQALNRDYRGIDKVTDVLSFPQYEGRDEIAQMLLAGDKGPSIMIGDVVICYEQAVRQAEEYGTGMKRELLYLFVHSIMHLFGYDHMNEEDKRIMREREEAVLGVIGDN